MKFKSRFHLLLISLASILILVILFELGFRIAGAEYREHIRVQKYLAGMEYSGFRQAFPNQAKKEGKFRILALGDSFTWGDALEHTADVWPSVLESRLNNENIDVINLAQRGFTTVNEFELLLKVRDRLKPDLVIVQFLINDCLPSFANFGRVGEAWLSTHKIYNLVPFEKAHKFFNKHSYLYIFLNRRFQMFERKIWPQKSWDELYRDDFSGWKNCKGALYGFAQVARLNNFKIFLVIVPNFPSGKWTLDSFPNRILYDKVIATAEDAGLEVLDLIPVFIEQGKDFSYWRVNKYDAHPGKEAEALMAEAIEKFIKERNLLE